MEPNLTSPKEILENYILGEVMAFYFLLDSFIFSFSESLSYCSVLLQKFEVDCFIPSPVIKDTSMLSFGPDLILAIQKIGMVGYYLLCFFPCFYV